MNSQEPKLPIKAVLFMVILAMYVYFMLSWSVYRAQAAEMSRPELFVAQLVQYTTIEEEEPQIAKIELDKSHIETFSAEISAYTAIETCPTTCNMANGKRAYIGAAACPRRIPLGTWVNIEGIGIVFCEDRTADWTDGRFDVFFGYTEADYQRAKQLGSPIREITINHSL